MEGGYPEIDSCVHAMEAWSKKRYKQESNKENYAYSYKVFLNVKVFTLHSISAIECKWKGGKQALPCLFYTFYYVVSKLCLDWSRNLPFF